MWWIIPPRYRLNIALFLAALLFGGYGVSELMAASRDNRSYRDGIEALVIAVIFLGLRRDKVHAPRAVDRVMGG